MDHVASPELLADLYVKLEAALTFPVVFDVYKGEEKLYLVLDQPTEADALDPDKEKEPHEVMVNLRAYALTPLDAMNAVSAAVAVLLDPTANWRLTTIEVLGGTLDAFNVAPEPEGSAFKGYLARLRYTVHEA